MHLQNKAIYEFGSFRLDPQERRLFREDATVGLTPKAFDLLVVFVESEGKLLTKQDLMQQVWPDAFVEEANLAQNVATLRKALGETVTERQFIETVSKQGYRFVAAVKKLEDAPGEAPVIVTVAGRAKPARHGWITRAAVPAIVLLAMGLFVWYSKRPSGATIKPNPMTSIVVLPFVNMNADTSNEYFSDGLTEEVINALAGVQGLRVVARTSAFQFKGKPQDIRAIADQLGVGSILEGSVRREQNRLRLTAQFINASNGYHVWSRTWDRELKDVFAVQQEIAQAIANTVRGNSIAIPVLGKKAGDLEAYNLYLEGRYHQSKRYGGSMEKAIGIFQTAVAKDPNYAAGWAALADCYEDQGFTGQIAPKVAYPKAIKAVATALALDETLANAHTVQAKAFLFYEWNWDKGAAELDRALVLNPSDPRIHHYRSHMLMAQGKFPESFTASKRALELDPLDNSNLAHLCWHYFYAGNYEALISAGQKSLSIDPNHVPTHIFLQWGYEQTGLFDKAIDEWEKQHISPQRIAEIRAAFRASGPTGYWKLVTQDALEKSEKRYVSRYRIARLQALSGDREKAIQSLELSMESRDSELVSLKVERAFDAIRADPRIGPILRKVGI